MKKKENITLLLVIILFIITMANIGLTHFMVSNANERIEILNKDLDNAYNMMQNLNANNIELSNELDELKLQLELQLQFKLNEE